MLYYSLIDLGIIFIVITQFVIITYIYILHFREMILMTKKKMKKRDFSVLFLRKAHKAEHLSRGSPHLVLISQLSRLKQCR